MTPGCGAPVHDRGYAAGMIGSNRSRRLLLPAIAAAALLASGAAPAAAATTCKAPSYPGSGYFTGLKVSGVSCGAGRALVKSHYRCRVKHGKTGTCTRVGAYRCTEKRQKIPTQFNARVTCRSGKSGSKRVVFTYQQNT